MTNLLYHEGCLACSAGCAKKCDCESIVHKRNHILGRVYFNHKGASCGYWEGRYVEGNYARTYTYFYGIKCVLYKLFKGIKWLWK